MALHIHLVPAILKPRKTVDGPTGGMARNWIAGAMKMTSETPFAQINSLMSMLSGVFDGRFQQELKKEREKNPNLEAEAKKAYDYLQSLRIKKGATKDADWSARHIGNYVFEVTTPSGKKISIGHAETSAEAIAKAKKLQPGATHDSAPAVGSKVRVQAEPGKMVEGTVKRVNGNMVSVAYRTAGGAQQEDFHVSKVFNSSGAAFSADATASAKDSKNFLGEKEYHTYQAWRTACKAKNPAVRFEGDKEICNAPGVGEWDGEKGVVYSNV